MASKAVPKAAVSKAAQAAPCGASATSDGARARRGNRRANANQPRKRKARPGRDPHKAAANRIRELLNWTPELDSLDAIVGHALAWERHLLAQAEPKIRAAISA